MNAGLEKALQHKDKLLEYDKNRYYGIHSAIIVTIDVEFASVIETIVGVIKSEEWLGYNAFCHLFQTNMLGIIKLRLC